MDSVKQNDKAIPHCNRIKTEYIEESVTGCEETLHSTNLNGPYNSALNSDFDYYTCKKERTDVINVDHSQQNEQFVINTHNNSWDYKPLFCHRSSKSSVPMFNIQPSLLKSEHSFHSDEHFTTANDKNMNSSIVKQSRSKNVNIQMELLESNSHCAQNISTLTNKVYRKHLSCVTKQNSNNKKKKKIEQNVKKQSGVISNVKALRRNKGLIASNNSLSLTHNFMATNRRATSNNYTKSSHTLFPEEYVSTFEEYDELYSYCDNNLPTLIIAASSFPRVRFKQNELHLIENCLANLLLHFPKSCEIPIFKKIHLKLGAVIVTCQNEYTYKWLKQKIPVITPWTGGQLQTITINELYNTVTVTTWVRIPTWKPKKILLLFAKQNPCLTTNQWTVISTQNHCDTGYLLTLAIDKESFRFIQSQNMTLHLGLGQSVFKRDNSLKNN